MDLHLIVSRILCHLPTSLAGTYAAVYALDDVGTAAMGIKEREEMMEDTGYRYGYGWFIGRDGERHFGIVREPLLGRP
jgi:hypothetical protein